MKPTNQDSAILTHQMVRIWIPRFHGNGPSRNWEGDFVKSHLPIVSTKGTFGFRQRLRFPCSQTVPLNEVSPLSTFQIGDFCSRQTGGSELLTALFITPSFMLLHADCSPPLPQEVR